MTQEQAEQTKALIAKIAARHSSWSSEPEYIKSVIAWEIELTATIDNHVNTGI